jgi:hypothetical protein
VPVVVGAGVQHGASMLRMLLSWIEHLGIYVPHHSRCVRRSFASRYPTCQIGGTRTIANEPERWVVAVFCQAPPRVSFPPLCKTFAVSKRDGEVVELAVDVSSPYWIHDRKRRATNNCGALLATARPHGNLVGVHPWLSLTETLTLPNSPVCYA